MNPTAKALLYSLIGLTCLVVLGMGISAISNTSTHFVLKRRTVENSNGKDTDDSYRQNFYIDNTLVPDRIIDPRDLPENRKLQVQKNPESSSRLLPSHIPVLTLPLGHSLNFQTIHYNHSSLRKRVYELVGIEEGGTGYEVKVSFLGSPPTNFDLKLFTLPADKLNTTGGSCELCDCQRQDDKQQADNVPKTPNTRRKLADIEKVMFRSAAQGASKALEDYRRQNVKEKGDSLCCCTEEQLSAKDEAFLENEVEEATANPKATQSGPEGVVYGNRRVVIDKTVAIPYETEHVVRHYESVTAANRAMGVKFLIPEPPLDGLAKTSSSSITRGGNRLFVVVSAFPKGVVAAQYEHLFSDIVQFNIKLEQLYVGGQFPLGIIIGLALVWPVCNVFLIVFLPRFMDVVKGIKGSEKKMK